MLSISTNRIGNAEHGKEDSGSPPKMVKDNSKLVLGDCYTNVWCNCLLSVDQSQLVPAMTEDSIKLNFTSPSSWARLPVLSLLELQQYSKQLSLFFHVCERNVSMDYHWTKTSIFSHRLQNPCNFHLRVYISLRRKSHQLRPRNYWNLKIKIGLEKSWCRENQIK